MYIVTHTNSFQTWNYYLQEGTSNWTAA